MYDYDDDGIPAPGETVWHGDKLYGTCDECYKLVQLNKRGFGSMHVCLSQYEKALKRDLIISLEEIHTILDNWSECEYLIREVGKKFKIRRASKTRTLRLAKKLNKKGHLTPSATSVFATLDDFIVSVKKSCKKGYEFGGWISPEDADKAEDAINTLNQLFREKLKESATKES